MVVRVLMSAVLIKLRFVLAVVMAFAFRSAHIVLLRAGKDAMSEFIYHHKGRNGYVEYVNVLLFDCLGNDHVHSLEGCESDPGFQDIQALCTSD